MPILKKNFLLVDVLPYEIPLLYSNFNLYEFVERKMDLWKEDALVNVETSVPHQFSIWKNDESKRTLSLLHPLGQLQLMKFVEIYDSELIQFCNLYSIFSIRYPSGINSIKQTSVNKLKHELDFILEEDFEYKNNEFEAYLDSYFEKKQFKVITYFFKSNTFKKLETKYAYMLRTDIQNCFEHIYTHSIDWAYLGDKELAKQLIKKKQRFSAQLDNLMQKINYGETNGIVVGPEFSRCVAEIVLMRIDYMVYNDLSSQNIFNKKDYEIARYIDDTFIFSNDPNLCQKIKSLYEEKLKYFKLDINYSKVSLEKRPFLKKSTWVSRIREMTNKYFEKLLIYHEKNTEEESIQWNIVNRLGVTLIEDIRYVMIENESQIDKIVGFVLTFFENNSEKLFKSLKNLDYDEQEYSLCSIIDILHYLLVFSITSSHVLQYILFMMKFYSHAKANDMDKVINLIYKKALELLKYNKKRSIELLNIIIFMRRLEKDLPEKLLMDYIQYNPGYFTLSSVLFYASIYGRKYRYESLLKQINKEIYNMVLDVQEKYIARQQPNPNAAKRLLTSNHFYSLHDYYGHFLIDATNKAQIRIIKDWLNRVTWRRDENKLFLLFWEYAKDFDKPFMQFSIVDNELTPKMIFKTKNLSSSGYD